MNSNSIILVTGAAGFIGSCLVGFLNQKGFHQIIIADEFENKIKEKNYGNKIVRSCVNRDELFEWLDKTAVEIDFIFHLGARTDTTEFDYHVLESLNVTFSKKIWQYSAQKKIPLVYASSAATYGDGSLGYKDDHELSEKLNPLNPYGRSKNEFDKWVLRQDIENQPPFWAGLKFFNVYGPNEYHKGRMASVIFHAYQQISNTGIVKLFRSHKKEYKDGEQLRDFIYVMDVVNVCFWLMENKPDSGIYNVGTGKARTFRDLVTAIFNSLEKKPEIIFIDTPEDIRDKYQYFTEADMGKLRKAGYTDEFHSLEKGVNTYVKDFLVSGNYY